jgi:phosphinothricin acetyltransferase
MRIRDAADTDFDQITDLYNDIVTTSTATYNDRLATVDDRLAWALARRQQGYPVLVADQDGLIAGFASFGDFRSWPGYRFTVEGTVYILANLRGQGVGTALLRELVQRAALLGKHSVIAGVDSENIASLRFLERAGFERVGHLREVGFKFDRFLDLVFLQYWVTSPSGNRDLLLNS